MVPVPGHLKPALRRRLGLPERPIILFPQSAYAPEALPALEWDRVVAQKCPQATFLVVGSIFPAPRVQGNIIATGPVDDSHLWFQASDISL